jgi:hypothetical protein
LETITITSFVDRAAMSPMWIALWVSDHAFRLQMTSDSLLMKQK